MIMAVKSRTITLLVLALSWTNVAFAQDEQPPTGEEEGDDFWVNAMRLPEDDCETPCAVPTEFCGSDGRCHNFNCVDWFHFGPDALVEEGMDTTVELSCRELSPDRPDTNFYNQYPTCLLTYAPWAVVVKNRTVVEKDPEQDPFRSRYCGNFEETNWLAAVAFDRKCTALMPYQDEFTLRASQATFVCYDFAQDESSTALDDFVATVDHDNVTYSYNQYLQKAGSYVSYKNPDWNFINETDIEFDLERARASMFVQHDFGYGVVTQTTNQYFTCDEGCPAGYFCGKDAQCHVLGDCQVYYQYGPPSMTGNQNDDSSKLSCTTSKENNDPHETCDPSWKDIDPPHPGVWPNAVQFHCDICVIVDPTFYCPNGPDSCKIFQMEGRELSFSRMCSAPPNEEDQSYLCFDTVGMLEADILAYEQRIMDNPTCEILGPNSNAPFARQTSPCYAMSDTYNGQILLGPGEWLVSHGAVYVNDQNETLVTSNLVDRDLLKLAMISELKGTELMGPLSPSLESSPSSTLQVGIWTSVASFLLFLWTCY